MGFRTENCATHLYDANDPCRVPPDKRKGEKNTSLLRLAYSLQFECGDRIWGVIKLPCVYSTSLVGKTGVSNLFLASPQIPWACGNLAEGQRCNSPSFGFSFRFLLLYVGPDGISLTLPNSVICFTNRGRNAE